MTPLLLQKLVLQACSQLKSDFGDVALGEIHFEHPELAEHGDYSTNIALVLAKALKKNPGEVAEALVRVLQQESPKEVERIEVAGPGFINFFLSKEYLVKELKNILKLQNAYGKGDSWKGKKVIVEFTDPNPFKVFHIGHLNDNAVGESLSRLFEATGAMVKRANYQGDVGMHVARAIWGVQTMMQEQGMTIQDLEKKNLEERVQFLAKAYARGTQASEENETVKKEIADLNVKIFALDSSIKELYEKGRAWSLEYFENIYKRLGTKFDFYYFESNAEKLGFDLAQKGLEKGIFEKSQGAVIFPGEKEGLHSRVFVNSLGLPTYEAKELGLAPAKYKDFTYDLSVIVTGNEIIAYFKVVLCALSKLYPELAEKTKHITHGMVRLPEGKMSSRTGNVITAKDLLDEVKSRVLSVMNVAGNEVPEKERDSVAEMIAIGAVKYSFLRVSIGKDIAFDFEKALSLQGDSGPYIQYVFARCKSILRKAESSTFSIEDLQFNLNKEEMDILRILYKFPEVVKEAAEKFSPNMVANFAFDLAQRYNLFYATHSVLQAESEEIKQFRLVLTQVTAHVIQNSLSLLGIQTPERM